jgi:RNA polymerase sigma-54 factor
MRTGLHLSTTQHLSLTPQLTHSIRLLQLSALEFEQELEESLANNPFLECEDPGGSQSPDSSAQELSGVSADHDAGLETTNASDGHDAATTATAEYDDATSSWEYDESTRFDAGSRREHDDELLDPTALAPAPVGLRQYLLEQLCVCRLDARQRSLVQVIIHALEPDGYLRTGLDELAALCPKEYEVEVSELDLALRLVTSFDPVGVGARNLAECLRLQLERRPSDTPGLSLAQRIIKGHLPELANPDMKRLADRLACSDAEFARAYQLIRACAPNPGLPFDEDRTEYVVADVEVRKVGKRWVARINPEVVPKISVNRSYAAILSAQHTSSASPTGQKLQEARWFVRNVNQRFKTILRVAQAIVERQSRFLEYGDVAMKPLVLRELAKTIGMHESTVSRVTCNKYMMTPRGLIEFKYFFGSHVESEGNACSSTAVRALIRQIIGSEDPVSPLSDVKITHALEQKGVALARRTVSKYRDRMKIPSVEVRRLSSPATANA